MKKNVIDRGKVRVQMRRFNKEVLLELIDRAVDMIPKSRLRSLVERYMDVEALRPDGARRGGLLRAVSEFRGASLRGDYYEDFAVDSKNYMMKSPGTGMWIAEYERLMARCLAVAKVRPQGEAREAFEVLFGLLRHVDEGRYDVVFFADEGGSYDVYVEWEKVLPAYFAGLAATATPEEFAEAVSGLVKDFIHRDRDRYLDAARDAATPEQKKALELLQGRQR